VGLAGLEPGMAVVGPVPASVVGAPEEVAVVEGTADRTQARVLVGRIHLPIQFKSRQGPNQLTLLRHGWWCRAHLLILPHRSIEISIHMLQLGYRVSLAVNGKRCSLPF